MKNIETRDGRARFAMAAHTSARGLLCAVALLAGGAPAVADACVGDIDAADPIAIDSGAVVPRLIASLPDSLACVAPSLGLDSDAFGVPQVMGSDPTVFGGPGILPHLTMVDTRSEAAFGPKRALRVVALAVFGVLGLLALERRRGRVRRVL